MRRMGFIILLLVSAAGAAYGEEERYQPFRLGLKIGSPNLAGLGLEYILPVKSVKIGLEGDVSYFPVHLGWVHSLPDKYRDTSLDVLYWAAGGKVFFNERATGFFLGANFARYSVTVTQDYHYMGQTASAEARLGANIIIAKAGYSWIWGIKYLAVDIGYGAGKIDDRATVTIDYPKTGRRVEVYHTDNIFPIAHGIVASLKFGVAF